MRADRLRRLTLLTQGAALIGLAGCSKESPIAKDPPHVNAPATVEHTPTATASATATATAPVVGSGSASVIPDDPDPPHVNSPAPKAPPAPPKVPKHTNSPG